MFQSSNRTIRMVLRWSFFGAYGWLAFAGTTPAAHGQCEPQARLTASDPALSDWFGWSVALSGDTALIGAFYDDIPNDRCSADIGSAYVFVRSGGEWTQEAKLVPSDFLGTEGGDWFGWSVALSGDSAIIGALFDSDAECRSLLGVNESDETSPLAPGPDGEGSAYIFTRSGGVWTQEANLNAPSVSLFGYSVAISDDTAVVSALDSPAAVYVFARSGGIWTQQATLTDPGANFGISVAIDGDTLVVGSPDDFAGVGANLAYVYTRSGGTWTQQAELIASDAADGDGFGTSVAISGDTVVAGAPGDDHGGPPFGDAGSAYVFTRSGSEWSQQAKLVPLDPGGGVRPSAARSRFRAIPS